MARSQFQLLRDKFIRRFRRIEMNTTPGDAAFLRIMVESSRAKRGVEVGTCSGYGAVLMGLGFERNGGRLTTIEIDPKTAKTARKNIEKVRLQETVTVIEGDALEVLAKLPGKYDFVFLDAVKKDYLKYLRAIEPRLKPGAVIVADNVVKYAAAMHDFLGTVQDDPHYDTVIIRASEEKGDGMSVSYKVK